MATIEERVTALETHKDNIYHQITGLQKDVKDIHTLATSIERIAIKTDSIDEKVDNISNRVSAIEREPADNYKHYKRLIVGCVISGVLGAIIAAVIAVVIK